MKSSIGGENPDDLKDADQNGVADRAERDFAADGRAATPTPATGSHPHAPAEVSADETEEADGVDDGGLESSRPTRGRVRPPEPN